MARDLYHLTLDTGHARLSPRAEVADAAISALRPLVLRAIAPDLPEIPATDPPAILSGHRVGGSCALLVVSALPPDLRHRPRPLVTIGIAGRSRCGARLWEEIHERRPALATAGKPQPPTPWCAVRLEEAIAEPWARAATAWLGDLERCLAWTWLELVDEIGGLGAIG